MASLRNHSSNLFSTRIVLTGRMTLGSRADVARAVCKANGQIGEGSNYVLVVGDAAIGKKPSRKVLAAIESAQPIVSEGVLGEVLTGYAPCVRLTQPIIEDQIGIDPNGKVCRMSREDEPDSSSAPDPETPDPEIMTEQRREADQMWARIVAKNTGLGF